MAEMIDTGTEHPVATYHIGSVTMRYVFQPNGIENVADMQRVFDAVEEVLAACMERANTAPYSAYVGGKFVP